MIAGGISLPLLLMGKKQVLKNWGVLICALCLGIALQFQTIGLGLTTLAKSGFLTVFYALFTPIFSLFLYGTKFRKKYWGLLAMAMLGMALLCDLKLESFNKGDFYTLISAIFFSGHILFVDKFGQNQNPIYFNMAQCFYVAIFCLPLAFFLEGGLDFSPFLPPYSLGANSFTGFLILSVFSSLIAFTLQIIAQKSIPAHIVSLIFLMESVFAAFFGYLFFGEVLSLMAMVGGGILIVSVALIPFALK